MSTIEDRLRDALQARASTIVPNQPHWDDLVTRPAAVVPPRRPRLWLAVATAALAVLVPYFLIGHFVRPAARLRVGGGTNPPDGGAAAGFAVTGPPDGSLAPGFSPVSVTRISLRTGWALGTAPCGPAICTALARTRDSGSTWHGVPVPPAVITPPTAVSRVRFANANDGWLFGPQVWATHDGGTTWHRVLALGGPVASLEAADGMAWGLMSAGGATSTVYAAPVATDDWKPVGPGPVASSIGISLHGKVGYTAAPDGAIVSISAAGVQERGEPCAAAAVSAVAAASEADVAVVCAADAGAGSSTKTLLLSHDSGRTWSTAGSPPRGGQPTGLAAASLQTFIVGATSGASYLYRTSDAGKTWTTVFTDAGGGAPFVDLGFTNASNGVAVLAAVPDPRLLVSSDAGATWKPQALVP